MPLAGWRRGCLPHIYCSQFWRWKSEMQVPADLGAVSPLPGCGQLAAFSLCLHPAFPRCRGQAGPPGLFLFQRGHCPVRLRAHHVTSLNLGHLLSHLQTRRQGGRASALDSGVVVQSPAGHLYVVAPVGPPSASLPSVHMHVGSSPAGLRVIRV